MKTDPAQRLTDEVRALHPRRAQGQADMLAEVLPEVRDILASATAGGVGATRMQAELLFQFVEGRLAEIVAEHPDVSLPDDDLEFPAEAA